MAKKKLYTIQYHAHKYYTINVEAESEEEAFAKAEDAYCDYDENDWEEFEENDGVECISTSEL